MSELRITVDHVSKKFCRSLRRSLWYGLRDLGSELIGRNGVHERLRTEEFWAVEDVSFQLNRGETLGVIGHNGAGKTTILRMLNGLIKPDVGEIEVRGRMQALIALGAGFNPVLTGRENVLVNASVLGLSKAEIDRKFDQIVDFSGIEEFIDMPVRSYSSGMTVRLGFSVAAHLEPDILLVDEVLAVGDLAFRTKCQVRIQELMSEGVAIILVSHNLHTVSHTCNRAIAVDRGRIIYDGETEAAIDIYRESLLERDKDLESSLRAGTGELEITRVQVIGSSGHEQDEFETGDPVTFRIHYEANQPVDDPVVNIVIHVLNSHQVTGIRTDSDQHDLGRIAGAGSIDLHVPHLNLLPNIYTLDAVSFHDDGYTFYDRANKIAHFRVKGGSEINGTAYLPHSWVHNPDDTSTSAADG